MKVSRKNIIVMAAIFIALLVVSLLTLVFIDGDISILTRHDGNAQAARGITVFMFIVFFAGAYGMYIETRDD